MYLLGKINEREIFYINIREDVRWFERLPNDNWVAFTITDDEDEHLIEKSIKSCLDKNVRYSCTTGELCDAVENAFDFEFVDRAIKNEDTTGKEHDYEIDNLMTTSHHNFSEGFWFAATTAYNDPHIFDKVICIDFTRGRVEKHLKNLISKINDDWLPSDDGIEIPVYDDTLNA